MSWLEDASSAVTREIRRVVALVRPLPSGDWLRRPGAWVRKTISSITEFIEEHQDDATEIAKDAIELGRHKLEGLAEQERAAAIQKFADAEKLKTEAEFNRRSLESKVRKEEAEARLKEIEVLRAEMAFLKELKDLKIAVRKETDGKWAVLPAPQDCDLLELIDSRVAQPSQIDAPKGFANRRASLDLTRADLAAMAGVSESTVARLEGRAWRKVSNITREKIVKALNEVRKRRDLAPLSLKDVFPDRD
jgi:DNA-binding XRE family transcriptional regulator